MSIFEERGITHLDLHGVRHHDVEDDVFDFVLRHQNLLPLIIICGNSNSNPGDNNDNGRAAPHGGARHPRGACSCPPS